MKKAIYDTPEMEIKQLRKDLDDLKATHQKESDILRKNACAWSIEDIIVAKARIESIRKQKQSIVKKIDKLNPILFQQEDFEVKKQDLINQLKKIAKMSKTELIDFNCKLSISNLAEKYKKPLNTCCMLRNAELCEIADISPLCVISEIREGDLF